MIAVYLSLFLILASVVGLYLWGRHLPETWQATRDVLIDATPERVWSVMTDYLRQVEWRTDLKSVQMAASKPGEECWTERPRRGPASLLRVATHRTGQFLEIERRLQNQMLSGSWTATLEHAAHATRVTLTETLSIANPFVRAFFHLWFNHCSVIDAYQRDLKSCVEARRGS